MDAKKVGVFLKELRKEYKMTQEQLGEKIGVTNKTISRWEKVKEIIVVILVLCMAFISNTLNIVALLLSKKKTK